MGNNVEKVLADKKTWLVTGCAGFIGSHLVERLLKHGHVVRGIDNFVAGFQANLDSIKNSVGPDAYKNFTFIDGDINDSVAIKEAMQGAEVVSHQAALGSVPRSIELPLDTVRANVEGFVSVAKAAADLSVGRFVYASSSSVYGNHPKLPKVESEIGVSLSPYAASKLADEIFAEAFASSYGIEFIGLRYFNIFGPRQDPKGAYAAVIPLWVDTLLKGERAVINGDATISRDFTYVDNAVDANILSAYSNSGSVNTAYNVGNGGETTLAGLHDMIAEILVDLGGVDSKPEPVIGNSRPGDIKHSLADISKAKNALGFAPGVEVMDGLRRTVEWFYKSR